MPGDPAALPDRACCCPAKPLVKAVMPPGPSRPAPADLWLCGHHWRASRRSLAEAGATVYDVSARPLAQDSHEGAPV